MNKQEVVAMLIMESASEPMKPQNLTVQTNNGLHYVRFRTILQEFNRMNRNRRNYASAPMMESLAAPHIQELISKGRFCGEAGHPMTEDPKRILTIDPKLLSHRVLSYNLEGNLLYGEVESIDDGMYGTQFTRHILQGLEPSFSLRALASLVKLGDGSALMQSKCHIVCYDSVILPSHDKAYRDTNTPIQHIYKGMGAGNTVTESGILLPVQENAIMDFIKLESANVKLVSNVCEVAMESMQLTPDGKHVILREGSQTYLVKTEEKIKHEVRRYMSRL